MEVKRKWLGWRMMRPAAITTVPRKRRIAVRSSTDSATPLPTCSSASRIGGVGRWRGSGLRLEWATSLISTW